LTNAPTPNLKKLYQKNLQELNEALEMVLQGGSGEILKDLPSSTPIYGIDEQTGALGGNTRATQPPTINRPNRSTSAADEKKASAVSRFKTWFGWMLAASILLLAGLVLLFIEYTETKKNAEDFAGKLKTTEAIVKDYANFKNGKFRIQNYGDSPLTINWIIITYRDSEGKLVKHEEYVDVSIDPNSRQEFKKFEGANEVWDGSVIAYACGLSYHGETFFQAGLWASDSRDGNLILNLSDY
jgi:hypothetical protein